MARRTIPAAEKAQKALDTADREVQRLMKQKNRLSGELDDTVQKIDAAKKRRDYAAQNPDLPPVQARAADDTPPQVQDPTDPPTAQS